MTPLPPGTPDYLRKAIEDAAREGRIVSDTGVRADAIPGPGGRYVSDVTPVDPTEFASEEEFQRAVIDLARRCNWLVAHFRPAWRKAEEGKKPRMVTPVAGDGKGFLDLILLRDRLIVAELKYATKLKPDQKKWFDAWVRAGVPVFVWYPCDWPEIVQVLGATR